MSLQDVTRSRPSAALIQDISRSRSRHFRNQDPTRRADGMGMVDSSQEKSSDVTLTSLLRSEGSFTRFNHPTGTWIERVWMRPLSTPTASKPHLGADIPMNVRAWACVDDYHRPCYDPHPEVRFEEIQSVCQDLVGQTSSWHSGLQHHRI